MTARILAAALLALALRGTSAAQTSPHGPLTIPCENCHTASSWNELAKPMKFDHASTGFELIGQHALVKCGTCHSTLRFKGTENRCSGCHDDIHRGELGAGCVRCHSPEAWLVPDMAQRHSRTSFPLVGAHLTADCQACHPNSQKHQYVGVRTDCYGCHSAEYEGSRAPNHRAAGFSTDCSQCHEVNDMRWGGGFDHANTGFPLVGAHASTPCSRCHQGNNFSNAGTLCIDCHRQQFTAAASPAHTGFPTDCVPCHSMTGWRPSTFDHNRTNFPLTGEHRSVACGECHRNGVYTGTPTRCSSCHQDRAATVTSPSHTGFPSDCATCHTTTGWRPSTFDHNRTPFRLTGAHVTASCIKCHVSGVFAGTPVQCVSCHQQNYAIAVNPRHSPGISSDCVSCHTTAVWRPSTFDHGRTNFQLTGAHPIVQCAQCHQNGVYAGTPAQCSGCHLQDAAAVITPSHASFPNDCVMCHSTTAWRPSSFDHNRTKFPLTGAHISAQCTRCHQNGVYAGTPVQCVSCHQQNYAIAVNPRHSPGISSDCVSCHTTAVWRPSTFDHGRTNFPLTGAHPIVQCAQCHQNGIYAGTASQCAGCHQAQAAAVLSPSHATLPSDCATCHTTTVWRPSTFDHGRTNFQLTGAHPIVQCAQCHLNGVYAGTPAQCSGCHLQDAVAVVTPSHASFPNDCVMCHSTTAWRPSSFDHDRTAFRLTGAHITASCIKCHVSGVYAGTPVQCVSCHQQNYASALNPRHSPGISSDCVTCHTTAVWRPSTFDHSGTNFRLTGAHPIVRCAQCHLNGVYAGTPAQCSGCHLQDAAAVITPSHASFPNDCVMCHSTTAWRPSSFDHNRTKFPLTGAHISAQCTGCHQNGVYAGTPVQCVSCHQQQAAAVVSPIHTGFSNDCTTCHTTAVWRPSTFDHNRTSFPLTGAHPSVACTQCHQNGVYAGTPAQCSGCHLQDAAAVVNPSHTGFPTDCATCHTTTVWRPSTFDHSRTSFQLTGAHIAVACNLCHANSVYTGTPATCGNAACHLQDYQNATNPRHGTGFSTDCATCHTTNAWQPALFDHSKASFQLTGAHVTTPCASCHRNGVYTGTPAACGNGACHLNRYNATTNPSHAAARFPLDCQICHSTTAWTPSSWDHNPYFPISAGSRHRPGRWNTCADCHTTASNYTLFSCIDCHEHSPQSKVDDQHREEQGYSYNSAACYRCHPQGDAGARGR